MSERRSSVLGRALRALDGAATLRREPGLLRPAGRGRRRTVVRPAQGPRRCGARAEAGGHDRRAALGRRPGPAPRRRARRRRLDREGDAAQGPPRRRPRSRRTTAASRRSSSTWTRWPAPGMTKLRDLGAALADFRKSGKKVIAYSDAYVQGPYYLAAQADEVYLHPRGHAADRGLRPVAQLLQGGPRPARRRGPRLPRRRVQVGRRAVPPRRHVARGARDARRDLRRPLARLPRPTSPPRAGSGPPTCRP